MASAFEVKGSVQIGLQGNVCTNGLKSHPRHGINYEKRKKHL